MTDELQPIWFPTWRLALAYAPFKASTRAAFNRQIVTFLRYCIARGAAANAVAAHHYLAERNADAHAVAREALDWFTRMSQSAAELESGQPAVPRSDKNFARVPEESEPDGAWAPPLAPAERGRSEWERALIVAARRRGLLWRTEQIYRNWASRFAAFVAPRALHAADARDIGAFLTMLAVTRRATRATQQQALNALLFLMQEALRQPVGDVVFRRARAGHASPAVLSVDECQRVIDQLAGTTVLMGELCQATGLAGRELVQLRVQQIDLAHACLLPLDAREAKRTPLPLPAPLIVRLGRHLERLRTLHVADLVVGLAGVALPDSPSRKIADAGRQWGWQWLFPSRETEFDPDSCTRRRIHICEEDFETAIAVAARAAGIAHEVTSNSLRHARATESSDPQNIQSILDLAPAESEEYQESDPPHEEPDSDAFGDDSDVRSGSE